MSVIPINPLLAVLDLGDAISLVLIILFLSNLRGVVSIGSQRLLLRRLDRKLDALLDHHQIKLPSKLSAEVQRLANDPKQKLAAIKLYRQQTGCSLAEGKAAIEEFSGE